MEKNKKNEREKTKAAGMCCVCVWGGAEKR